MAPRRAINIGDYVVKLARPHDAPGYDVATARTLPEAAA